MILLTDVLWCAYEHEFPGSSRLRRNFSGVAEDPGDCLRECTDVLTSLRRTLVAGSSQESVDRPPNELASFANSDRLSTLPFSLAMKLGDSKPLKVVTGCDGENVLLSHGRVDLES